MACIEFSKAWNTRHDMIAEAWRCIIDRAGCAPSLEPKLRTLVPGGIAKGQKHHGKRGDILLMLYKETVVTDVSLAHVSLSLIHI